MTDRLAELTQDKFGSSNSKNTDVCEDDPEDPLDEMNEEEREAFEAFQKETTHIAAAIEKVEETVKDIECQYDDAMSRKMNANERLENEKQVQRLLSENEKRTDAIRKRLKRIAGENKMFRGEFPNKTGELRVRVNTHQGITRKFMAAMESFEQIQEEHRSHVTTAMTQHLRSMNPTASDEEIATAVKEGEEGWIADNSPIMKEMSLEDRQRLRNGLEDLKSRNNDIKKLEASIITLHQLFTDMQVLVESQGELLNNIEYNIEETKVETEAAQQELVQARNHQKSANKKKCFLAVIIVAILLGIIIPVSIKYIPLWFPDSKAAELVEQIPGATADPAGSEGNSTETTPAETAPAESQPAAGRAYDQPKTVHKLAPI